MHVSTAHCCVLLLQLAHVLGEGQSVFYSAAQDYTSLPFAFGLVVSAYGTGTEQLSQKSETISQAVLRHTKNAGATEPLGAGDSPRIRSFEASMGAAHVEGTAGSADLSVANVESTGSTASNGAVIPIGCASEAVLQLRLESGTLRNSLDMQASIDANHQLQFDSVPENEPVQRIGWSVTAAGELAMHGTNLFYQCHSGESYKVFDAPVHSRCLPVMLEVVELANCS